MLHRLLTLFFLQLGFISYCQILNLCQSDNLVLFSVVPSSSQNTLEWEFIYGNGAEIVNGQFSDSINVFFASPGDYVLQLREFASPNCFTPVDLIILVSPNPLASFSSGDLCIYDTVKFLNNSESIDGIQTSIWRIGDEEINTVDLSYSFDETGEYLIELSVISNSGCSDKESMFFNLSDKPIADFYNFPEKVTTLNPTVEFVNLSTEGLVNWSFGNDFYSEEWQPMHYFDTAGWYDIQLNLEDENGCTDSITKSVFVENNLIFYMPTSFTPNGDGLNDVFSLRGYEVEKIQEFTLEITNRWGEVIFSNDDIKQGWDGRNFQGNEAMTGTYLWSIRLKDELGKQTRQIGEVTLLR